MGGILCSQGKREEDEDAGCCKNKGQMCGEWSTKQRVAFYGSGLLVAGWAAYTGRMATDPPTTSPVLSQPSMESTALTALVGYTLGPLMLIYGHRIEETIVILNSLVTAGVGSFIESMKYLRELNADVSGGRVMPMQIVNLLKICLGAFALSTTSLKVPKFKAMMKGGIIADLVVTTITDQMPGINGCACEGYPCSPKINGALYEVEPSCFHDKWTRWWIKYIVCTIAALIATKVQEGVRKWNGAMLAANLCNEAIYDTSLALYPTYGQRIQPYRMFTLGMFASFGFMSQVRLVMLDCGYKRPFCLRGMYVWLNRVGNVVMVPLMFFNKLGHAMKNLGNTDFAKAEGKAKPSAIDFASSKGRKAAFAAAKLVLLNPATARTTLLVVNCAIFCLASALVVLSATVLHSPYVAFVKRDFILVLMLCGVFLIFTSFLGCRAGSSNSFKFLIPYSAVLAGCLVLQVAGGSYIYDNYKATSREAMEQFAQGKMEAAWVEGNCSMPAAMPPFSPNCTNPLYRSYQEFMINGCEYKGPGDLLPLRKDIITAMDNDNPDLVKYYTFKYTLVAETKNRIYQCLAEQNVAFNEVNVTDTTGAGAFCICRSVLMANLDAMRNVCIVAFIMVGLQVLLLLMSCKLMGVDLTEVDPTNPMAIVRGGGNKMTV